MTNLTNLINTIDELKDVIYGLPGSDLVNSAKKIINNSIKSLLNEYCETSEHFESVQVVARDIKAMGCYYTNGAYIAMKPMLWDFVNNYKDELEDSYDNILEFAINTYLHESRHAKQHADEMEIYNNDSYKVGSTCEGMEFFDLYYDHPKEVDARDYAEMYTEDAMAYIDEHLFERVVPQIQSLLGM